MEDNHNKKKIVCSACKEAQHYQCCMRWRTSKQIHGNYVGTMNPQNHSHTTHNKIKLEKKVKQMMVVVDHMFKSNGSPQLFYGSHFLVFK
jgi:hypothetical protein